MKAQQQGGMPWTQQATSMQTRQMPMQATSVLGTQQATTIDINMIINLMIVMMIMVMMMKMMGKVAI